MNFKSNASIHDIQMSYKKLKLPNLRQESDILVFQEYLVLDEPNNQNYNDFFIYAKKH